MAIIYKHIRLDTGQPFYIGVGEYPSRAYNKHSRSRRWKYFVSEFSYKVEIIYEGLDWGTCYAKERELIAHFGREIDGGILTNVAKGGKGRCGSYRPISEEQKLYLSQINTGDKHPMYGKSPSTTTRDKISKTLKARPVNWERVRKAVASKKGKPALNKKSIRASSLTGEVIGIYPSMSEAAKTLGVSLSNLCNVCKGKLPNTKGYVFSYC